MAHEQQRATVEDSNSWNLDGIAFFDNEMLPPSLVRIGPILRVANEIEWVNPRVAYLCKSPFHISTVKVKALKMFDMNYITSKRHNNK